MISKEKAFKNATDAVLDEALNDAAKDFLQHRRESVDERWAEQTVAESQTDKE